MYIYPTVQTLTSLMCVKAMLSITPIFHSPNPRTSQLPSNQRKMQRRGYGAPVPRLKQIRVAIKWTSPQANQRRSQGLLKRATQQKIIESKKTCRDVGQSHGLEC